MDSLSNVENPETERLRKLSIDLAAFRQEFFTTICNKRSVEIDPVMQADRDAILRDLDLSLEGLDQESQQTNGPD